MPIAVCAGVVAAMISSVTVSHRQVTKNNGKTRSFKICVKNPSYPNERRN